MKGRKFMKKKPATRKQMSKQLDKKSVRELAGILGTKGDMIKSLLEEKKKDRRQEDAKIHRFKEGKART